MKSTTKQQWESSDFPILCKNCLGDNPFMRMTKENYGQDCKICLKPFTVFRWCPGKGLRYRRTEICQTCCKLKNTCQSCILDLQYGLPIQIRDGVLQVSETCPQNDANREYYLATNASKLARNDVSLIDYEKTDPAAKEILEQLSRKYMNKSNIEERNSAPPCSFFAKGNCSRGDECPYRHILLTGKNITSLKSYRDRYYGNEDPAAAAILQKNPELQNTIDRQGSTASLLKPEDRTIKSLFIMGIRDQLTAKDVLDFFKADSIKIVADGAAAIVSFKTRLDAEESAEDNMGLIDIKNVRVKVSWARSPSKTQQERILKKVNESKQEINEITDYSNLESGESVEDQPKSFKKAKGPPLPPSANNKPEYLSRHIDEFSKSK